MGAKPPPGTVERAADIIAEGGVTPWETPSRFGPPGMWARKALLRVLRPYIRRQREVDRALLDAISAAGAGDYVRPVVSPSDRAATEFAAPLPEDVTEVETAIGRILLDTTDSTITPLIAEHGDWEGDVVAFVRNHLGPGMTFVDVGAHVGYFSVLASGLVGPAGHVFAIEPEGRNLQLLRANLWRNHCDNVTVLPVAAYHERGHVRFVSNPDGLAGSWIEAEQGERATMVPCAPLDELLGELRVDLMKIDIERSEPEAIEGAKRLIGAAPSLDIVAEFWPTHAYARDRSPADVLARYESLGLQLRLLQPDGTTIAATAEEVLAGGESGPIMNIVLRKR